MAKRKNHPEQNMRVFLDLADELEGKKGFDVIYSLMISRWNNEVMSEYLNDRDKPVEITYKEFDLSVKRAASALSNALCDVEKGSFVGLKLKNHPNWPVVFWGLLMSGYCPVLMDPSAGVEKALSICKKAGACAIVCEDGDTIPQEIKAISLSSVTNGTDAFDNNTPWADMIAFCTSGTTRESKICVYDSEAIVAQILNARIMPDYTDDIMYPKCQGDVKVLAFLPFYHIFGFVAVLLWYTFFGRTVVYPRDSAPKTLLYTCRRLKVSHIYSVPLFWTSIVKFMDKLANDGNGFVQKNLKKLLDNARDLSGGAQAASQRVVSPTFIKLIQKKVFGKEVRFMISGGGYIHPGVLSVINALGYPLYNGYGLTEAGITSVDMNRIASKRIAGSIGMPLYGVEYRIDPYEGAQNLGELYIRAPQLHKWTLEGSKLIPREGEWYATKDVARKNKNGFYWIVGRADDVIISESGEKISPDELEYYFSTLPYVNKVAVFDASDKATGEGATSDITMVLELERSLTDEMKEELISAISDKNSSLAISKRIKSVYISTEGIATVSTFKVRREALRSAFKAQRDKFIPLGENITLAEEKDYSAIDKEIIQGVREIFSSVLGVPLGEVGLFDDFALDLEGDSFLYVEMLAYLDRKYEVTIPEGEYAKYMTVMDIALLIHESKKG